RRGRYCSVRGRCDIGRVAFFFFKDPATTEIYALSLHDALPISPAMSPAANAPSTPSTVSRVVVLIRPFSSSGRSVESTTGLALTDRKSTRLNSSHVKISYAVFCLKKKNKEVERSGTLKELWRKC